MSQIYNYEDIQTICTGATILASGGGGSYQVGSSIVQKAIPPGAELSTIILSDVQPTDWICVSCDIGEPSTLIGHPHVHAPGNALNGLQQFLERQSSFAGFTALVPVEIGAVSSIIPFVVSVQTSLPVVDADGAGRAVPTLPLLTYAGYGIPLYPSCLASNEKPPAPVAKVFADVPFQHAEVVYGGVFRAAPFDGIAGLACWMMNGTMLKSAAGGWVAVGGTLANCHAVGSQFNAGGDVVANLVKYMNGTALRYCKPVFVGNVTDMTQESGPQDLGTITIANDTDVFTIHYQNENMYATLQSYSTTEAYIMGPDSICYVPAGTTVWDNSDLYVLFQAGQHPAVTVLGIDPAPEVLASATLVSTWQSALASIGYSGSYLQPWKTVSQ